MKLSVRRILLLALSVALVGGLSGFFLARRASSRHQPLPPTGVPLVELVLREGRMYHGDAPVPFTGMAFESYPDGLLQSRSSFVDGLLNGVSEGFFTSGALQIREHFTNGISHGLRTRWFASGTRLSEAQIDQGRIVGVFRRWHENGALAEEVPMSNDLPEGISRAFYPDGRLKAEVRLEHGKVVEQRFWKEGEGPVHAPVPADS